MKRIILFFILAIFVLILISPVSVSADERASVGEAVSTSETASSPIDKAFGTFTIVIMSIGILGLPTYFWLNSRRKRLLAEYEENKSSSSDTGEEIEE